MLRGNPLRRFPLRLPLLGLLSPPGGAVGRPLTARRVGHDTWIGIISKERKETEMCFSKSFVCLAWIAVGMFLSAGVAHAQSVLYVDDDAAGGGAWTVSKPSPRRFDTAERSRSNGGVITQSRSSDMVDATQFFSREARTDASHLRELAFGRRCTADNRLSWYSSGRTDHE